MKAARITIRFLILILLIALAGFFLYINQRYALPVLMYHNIDTECEFASLCVSPDIFERQMRYLVGNKYNIMSLDEYVSLKRSGSPIPRKSAVVTFDDGYEDNYTNAYPILKKYKIPATIFVITDPETDEDYLSAAQMREMQASGLINFGSHSLIGGYLPGRESAELRDEIGLSKRHLEAVLGKEVKYFCYPLGGFTAEIQDIVRANGYQAACTTNRGYKQTYKNEDIYAIKRVKMSDSANPIVLWVKLSGFYNNFRWVPDPHK